MSVILVAEQDASHAERISKVLRSHNLDVEIVNSRPEALSRAEALAPRLLLATSTFPEAAELFAAFSRTRGGPGAVLLVDADQDVSALDLQADEVLPEPFSDEELWHLVQHCLEQAPERQSTTPRPTPASEQLTSADIFGDVLAEVEAEAKGKQPALEPSSVPNPRDDIERRLEETLSGVMPNPGKGQNRVKIDHAPPDAPSGPSDSEIDDLLDRTLSSLDISTRTKKTPDESGTPAPTTTLDRPEDVALATASAAAGAPIEDAVPAAPVVDEPSSSNLEDPPLPSTTADTPPDSPDPDRSELLPTFEPLAAATDVEYTSPDSLASTEDSSEAHLAKEAAEPSIPDTFASAQQPNFPEAPELTGTPPRPTDALIDMPSDGDQFRTQVMPMLTPRHAMSAGENFGDYTLLDRIALGGMAEVWRARRKGVEGFQKTVAIKKILSHLTGSADFVTMFIDEAKLAAQLSHNNIIQIYDLGKVGNDFFIAMEYVEGKDLRSILLAAEESKQPIPIGLGLLTISAVARALDYAHRKRDFEHRALGLVHRDVSPQNVLLSYEGEIKLCDFGIVKAVAKASTTQMGALKGKLQYMSPEQAWGKSVDARSDIFSLGAVLFEVLTGSKLFSGDSEIGVLDAVRECRIPSPRELVPEIPKQVDRITRKALAKKPDERYQTAGEMEQELKAVLDGLSPTPSPKDLAIYLNSLFSPDIQSSQDSSKPTPEDAPSESPSGVEPASSNQVVPSSPEAETEGRSNLKWVLAAVLAAALAGLAFWLLNSRATDIPEGGSAPTQAVGSEAADSSPSSASPTNPGSEGASAEPADESAPLENTTPEAAPPETATDKTNETDETDTDTDTDTADSPQPQETSTQGESPPTATGLDLEQMVNEELESRAERLRQDFEVERKRLEKELAAARDQDESAKKAADGDQPGAEDAQSGTKEEGGGGDEP